MLRLHLNEFRGQHSVNVIREFCRVPDYSINTSIFDTDYIESICTINGIPQQYVTPSRDVDNAFELIFRFMEKRVQRLIIFTPAFTNVAAIAQIYCKNMEIIEIDMGVDPIELSLALRFYLEDEQKTAVYLMNPNNPTGHICVDLKQVIEEYKQVCFIIDETYIEYVDQWTTITAAYLVPKYEHVFVCRTFAKTYGIAALRAGYIISNHTAAMCKFINALDYSPAVDRIVRSIAENYIYYIAKNNEIKQERYRILERLIRHGYFVLNSQANFYTLYVEDAEQICGVFKSYNILIRNVSSILPGFISIAIGTMVENEVVLNILTSMVAPVFHRDNISKNRIMYLKLLIRHVSTILLCTM
jgi:histidinol-phosphate aminotransferase